MIAVICALLLLFLIAVFARIILSWIPLDPDGAMATIGGFLYVLTDPVMTPLRRAIPPVRLGGMALDLSPIILLIGLQVVMRVVFDC